MAAGSARGTAWQDGARRVLEYAIAGSLALHALALLSLPALPPLGMRPAPAQPPLEARLMPAPPVEAPGPPPPPKIEQAPAPPPTPHPAPRRILKPARPVREPAPEPLPAPVIAAPAPAPVVAPVRQPPVVAAPAPAPAPAPRAAPPPDPAQRAAQYRAALMAEAARYKRYPRFARDNGWQGRVELRLEIGPGGEIASLRVARGTGYAILDQQALEMVRSAAPQVAIPEGLRGKAFSVEIPVLFSLRDPDA